MYHITDVQSKSVLFVKKILSLYAAKNLRGRETPSDFQLLLFVLQTTKWLALNSRKQRHAKTTATAGVAVQTSERPTLQSS